MQDIIPHPASLEDARAELARQLLAELPPAEDNERPYFWIGRLRYALGQLLDVAAPAPAGLDAGQREVLAQALADAVQYRTPAADCTGCENYPAASLCDDHAADLDLTDAYLYLAAELGIEVDR